jgi:hypothetical protein
VKPPVPLTRRFRAIAKDADTDEEESIRLLWGHSKLKSWQDLEEAYRTVILADAGAGKTFEMEGQARILRKRGCQAFFLRLESIADQFADCLEVGTGEDLSRWLDGEDEGWFFLDSVDEARLDNPKAFENAIRSFATIIENARHRAHVYISSRPYAWRARLDRDLIERFLPFDGQKQERMGEGDAANQQAPDSDSATPELDQSGLVVYWMCPLDRDDIRTYSDHREVADVDGMLGAIDRADLWSLAERPFDLDDLADAWNAREPFTDRLAVLQNGIRRRLAEIHPDRDERQPLALDRALEGARQLAFGVVVSGQPGIRVPEGMHNPTGLNAEDVLKGWGHQEIRALLARGLFNDAIFGAVRIRHREVRELLAAEWLHEKLKAGAPRHRIEGLIFAEMYGESVVRPRMRPILPWLILFDSGIRNRALALHPEIAVEGGDVARLPLPERRRILHDMVGQIIKGDDDRNGRDNAAIARIAKLDLEDDARALIEQHQANEDAIFFLGRLVWQGQFKSCLTTLTAIATDPARGFYARLASVRAVASIGSDEQKGELWRGLIGLQRPIERRILAELLDAAVPDSALVEFLLAALELLQPHEEFEASGLSEALHGFVDRLHPADGIEVADLLLRMAIKLNELLDMEPHVERGECRVSKPNRWLMPVALHVSEKLILARAPSAFHPAVIAILLKAPALRFWSGSEITDYRSRLGKAVPDWPEINDSLFWASIDEARAALERKSHERLVDDWPVTWPGHYWQLDQDAFERVVGWIRNRSTLDDQMVALARAFRIYASHDRPKRMIAQIRKAVDGNAELRARLDTLLKPPKSGDADRWKREDAQRKRRQREQDLKEAQARADYAGELQADPDRVRQPQGLQPGEISNDQYWLLRIIEGEGVRTNRRGGADWRSLIPEFGVLVAEAFRDAALAQWRAYRPGLRSEGADTNSTPYALIFAMAGLLIEADESPDFPDKLEPALAEHALRYFVWELNGFPQWFEGLFTAFPETAFAMVWRELEWELSTAREGQPLHYVLHDLVYHAPWMHSQLAAPLLGWLESHDVADADSLRYVVHILKSGGVGAAAVARLAQSKLAQACPVWQRPSWFALWVDGDAEAAIPALAQELGNLPEQSGASLFAQQSIVALIGERRSTGPVIGTFKTARHLARLYALMHRYIVASDDIERAGKGVYSPVLRDHAQEARNLLFNLLSEIPGKATYVELMDLAASHPNIEHRHWMARHARNRAVADAELLSWTARQIAEFAEGLEVTPRSQRELFEIGISRLTDFKAWLEGGNDSLATTYQKVSSETEMRNVVANWLNLHAAGRYVCAQEPELANAQRPDIWLQHPGVAGPVPIELKLLDMDWTGPKLCERLRNQLAGDYLRDQNAGCGIMLLIWQGGAEGRRWEIEGRRLVVGELAEALSGYWLKIAAQHANVEAVEVIVIDLTVRAVRSNGSG